MNTDHLPPKRRLPPYRRDQILRSVLREEEPSMSPHHRIRQFRWIAPIAVGAAAALIAIGTVALTDGGPSAGPGPTEPAILSDGRVSLDLGPMSGAETQDRLAECLGGVDDADEYEVHLARWMDDFKGPMPVVFATVRKEHLYGGKPYLAACSAYWELVLSEGRKMPVPNAEHPVVKINNPVYGGQSWLDQWAIQGFYRVADAVDRVEVRVGTRGGPEPWRVATPHDGFVYWSAWFTDNPYSPDDKVWLRWRAYDTDGDLIDPESMPDQPRLLPMSRPKSTD